MADVPSNADSAAPVPDSTVSSDIKPAEANTPAGPISEPTTADTTKPADTPAATANGATSTASATNANGLNGAAAETKQPVPESQTATVGSLPVTGEQNNGSSSLSKTGKDGGNGGDGKDGALGANASSKPTPPAASILSEADKKDSAIGPHGYKDANTGANPFNSTPADSAPTATENKDTAAPICLASESKPDTDASTSVPTEKEDVEMEDAPLPSATENSKPDTTTAPASGIPEVAGATGAPTATPALATPAAAAATATGTKRKVDTAEAEEPAAKKQKGTFSKVMDKAKEAVKDVKEKAKPGRKPGKKAKKETAPPPVGRTERKTRSQARSGNE